MDRWTEGGYGGMGGGEAFINTYRTHSSTLPFVKYLRTFCSPASSLCIVSLCIRYCYRCHRATHITLRHFGNGLLSDHKGGSGHLATNAHSLVVFTFCTLFTAWGGKGGWVGGRCVSKRLHGHLRADWTAISSPLSPCLAPTGRIATGRAAPGR